MKITFHKAIDETAIVEDIEKLVNYKNITKHTHLGKVSSFWTTKPY